MRSKKQLLLVEGFIALGIHGNPRLLPKKTQNTKNPQVLPYHFSVTNSNFFFLIQLFLNKRKMEN